MFGGSDDPFGFGMFHDMRRQMNDMDRMMNMMMDPFSMLGMGPPREAMLEDRPRAQARRNPEHVQPRHRQLATPFDMFGGFGMGGIFNTMDQLQTHAMNDPNAHVYTQSTMVTFDGAGRPHVVENSMRKAGDVKETRRRVTGGEKEEMSIGHSIGDRQHVIEKKRDKDGNVRSQQRFVNLDEAEAREFDREFHSRAATNMRGGGSSHAGRRAEGRHAIDGAPGSGGYNTTRRASSQQQSSDGPIITLPEEEEEAPRCESSGRSGGPIIREISEEEAEQSIPKRRKGERGRFFRANDE